jgi:hypothetical protein
MSNHKATLAKKERLREARRIRKAARRAQADAVISAQEYSPGGQHG